MKTYQQEEGPSPQELYLQNKERMSRRHVDDGSGFGVAYGNAETAPSSHISKTKQAYSNPIVHDSAPVQEEENHYVSGAKARRLREMQGSNPLAQLNQDECDSYIKQYNDSKTQAVDSYLSSDSMRGVFQG